MISPAWSSKVQAVLLAALFLEFTASAAITRTFRIESVPSEATVFFDGARVGTTPYISGKINFKADSALRIQVSKERFAAQERVVDYNEVRNAVKSSSDAWTIRFTLPEIERRIPVDFAANVEGAAILIEGKSIGNSPVRQIITFTRTNEAAPWSTVKVRAEKSFFQPEEKTLSVNFGPPDQPWKATFTLAEIRREIPVKIVVNEPGAIVSINDRDTGPLSSTTLDQTLAFERANGAASWPMLTLKVRKEGYEYRPPGGAIEPVFTRTISVDEARQGRFVAEHFYPMRFVMVPIRMFEVLSDRVKIVRTNVLSEVEASGQEKPTSFSTIEQGKPFILSRIASFPDAADRIVYSFAQREERSTTNRLDSEIVGANIIVRQGSGMTPMTKGRYFDLDPFVSKDEESKPKWIYFSSDRSGKRIIWRMPASGSGGLTPITGNFTSFDTEPAISPDGSRLAFTSRFLEASLTSPPYIWTADADGKLPTQIRAGQSPAWDLKGERIAFVSPDHKIWVMNADGTNPIQLTQGDSLDCCPVWRPPSGSHIIYASNSANNDRKERNYDIWMMLADGSNQVQLTFNGSFDSFPAVSSNGKYVYFFSNRGAQREGQESLLIYRIELPE